MTSAAREALHLPLHGLDLLAASSALCLGDGRMEVLEEVEELLRAERVQQFLCVGCQYAYLHMSKPDEDSRIT